MSLATIEDTPNLAMHEYPSAALFGVIRQNLLVLDAITRLGRTAFCGGYGHPQELVTDNPYREAWGSFRALPGLTTQTTAIRSSGVTAGDVLRLYLGGSLAQTWTLTNGDQVLTAALGSYATNSVVEVQWDVYNAGKPAHGATWGNFELIDAYVGPVSLSDPFPTPTAFSGSYVPAATQNLADAVDWLVRLVGRRTEPLFQSLVRWQGPYGPTWDEASGQTTVRWHGGVAVSPAAPTLRARGVVWVIAPATEQIRLLVNDSVVASYAVPTTPGVYGWTLSYGLPQSAGTTVRVAVDYRRSSNPPQIAGAEPVNRWSLQEVALSGEASLYPAISIPTITARSFQAWETWKTALNACVNAATTIKARIDANPDLWTRQRLFRRRYAYDEAQNRWFEPGQIALTFGRRGEAVLVRGQGNQIVWGPQTWDEQQPNDVGLYPLKPILSSAVCQGDTPRSELVYLDTLGSLYPSAPYNVRGEHLAYAGEVWRVALDI